MACCVHVDRDLPFSAIFNPPPKKYPGWTIVLDVFFFKIDVTA